MSSLDGRHNAHEAWWENWITSNGTDLQPSTRRLYGKVLRRWWGRMGLPMPSHSEEVRPLVEDTPRLLRALTPDLQASTVLIYVRALLNVLQAWVLRDRTWLPVYRRWIAVFAGIDAQVRQTTAMRASLRGLPPTLTWDAVRSLWQEHGVAVSRLTQEDLRKAWARQLWVRYVYLSWYAATPAFPPLRAEITEIRKRLPTETPDPMENTLVVGLPDGEMELTLRSYKTRRQYGIVVRRIPSPLREILTRSFDVLPRTHVLPCGVCRPHRRELHDLDHLVGQFFPDVNLGPSRLRALFVRDYVAQQPWSEQVTLAKQMLHGIRTSLLEYRPIPTIPTETSIQ